MTVGDRIRLFARTRFKTQVRFAEAVGMKEQAISNLANGHQMPATETLLKFAEVGMNINWLFTGIGPMDALTSSAESEVGTTARSSLHVVVSKTNKKAPPELIDELRAAARELEAVIDKWR